MPIVKGDRSEPSALAHALELVVPLPPRLVVPLLAPLTALVALGVPSTASAVPGSPTPVATTTTTDAHVLIDTLRGPGVTVSNPALTGSATSSGTFSGGTDVIGFDSGVVLATGNADIGGSNTSAHGGPVQLASGQGDADLDALAALDPGNSGATTRDTAALELDVTANEPTVYFDYVFASDEYPEFTNQGWNDVFGLFVGGTSSTDNCALVPGTTLPVSVDTINASNNTASYRPNHWDPNTPSPLPAEPDGFTTVLQCQAQVTPNQPTRIKLTISDVGDQSYTSWIFFRMGSLSTSDPAQPREVCGNGLDDDNDGSVDEACPVAADRTSTGGASQSTTVPVPTGGAVTLLDAGSPVNTLNVPGQGLYTLDPATGAITFTRATGFIGAATPATYRVEDVYAVTATATYTPTVVAAPAPTNAATSGPGAQSTVLRVPAGDRVDLLDGGAPASQVVVPEGTYSHDVTTGTISFVPRAGFVGRATPVTFRVTDPYGQVGDATYTATVTATPTTPVTPNTPATPTTPTTPAEPTGSLTTPSVVRSSPGRAAAVPATCRATRGEVRRCTITLTTTVRGRVVTVGRASFRGATGEIVTNRVGRTLAAQPGGFRATATMVATLADGRTVTARSTSAVMASRVVLARRVLFDAESAAVRPADAAWLRSVRSRLGPVKRVVCVGHTDNRGSEPYNDALSRERAASACALLDLPRSVRTTVTAIGKNSPAASNATPQGRQQNRRAVITLAY